MKKQEETECPECNYKFTPYVGMFAIEEYCPNCDCPYTTGVRENKGVGEEYAVFLDRQKTL